jgi:hypothetical protein
MDPNAGSNYLVMGTSRLQAVPFAFYANGVDANNVKGVLPLSSGGTGVASMTELKSSLGLDVFNNAALETKVDKVAGKGLSTNDYTTAEKNKLEAITGTNTGDQDLSGYATTAQLATKANASDLTTSLATKANSTDVTTSLAAKANAADVTTSLATKANTADVTTSLAAKANASDVTTSLATKVDKVSGKDLSTNDYTTAEKTKLAAITGTNTGDQVNITGNAGTATKLQNSRTINGVAFDGSANITLPAATSGIPYTGATQAVNLGAFNLTVNGMTIGRGLNTGPDTNSAFGKSALASNTGFGNTATGFNALSRNTSGAANTATGWEALGLNTTGKQNAAFGWQVLYKNTGDFNTGAGESTLKNNTSGNGNSAFGQDALANNSTGSNNTAIGLRSLASNTTGSNNTAIGALSSVGSLTNATAIGYQATAQGDNSTAIGNGAIANTANTIRLGNNDVTDVNTKGTFTATAVQVSSDLRLKTNISPLANSLETVMQLNPVHYMKKGSLASTGYTREENGFIAQEIQKILPFVVTEGTDENKLLSVDYNSFIPMLTKAIQEQQKQIEDQNAKIAAQQKQIEELIKLVKGQ